MRSLAALLLLSLTACTGAYATLTATARAGTAAAAEFRQWDAQHKRQLLAAARPQCAPAPDPRACYAGALQPYQQQREPALKAADIIGALLAQAAVVTSVGNDPARLTAEIAEGVRVLALELAKMRSKP